jgi:hypothetical protein
MHSPMALAGCTPGAASIRLNSSASRALFNMDLIIAFLVVFGLGFGAGYATRERKSRMRRRRYYQSDSSD